MAAITGLDSRFERLSGAIGAGGGVTVHGNLTGRDSADQHPMSAITGLEAAFQNLTGSGITQSAADDRYVQLSYTSAGGGRVTQDEVAAGYGPLAKTATFYDLKADFGCVGDGVTDDTTCIGTALEQAILNTRPLYARDGVFNTTGGYLIDAPIIIVGENATFALSANATLFDASANYVTWHGFDIKVPDTNTASVLKYTTSATRLQGRGWGPTRKFLFSNSRIYSAGAENWSQTPDSGEDTDGDWTAIEFVGDTTGGNAGIDFVNLRDIYIEFPDTGIKFTKIGTGGTWFNDNSFQNIYIAGFTTGITTNGMSASGNEMAGIKLHHVKGTAAHGVILDGSSNDNIISMSAWNDSGWQTTRSAFTPYEIAGTGNTIQGFAEYSVGAEPTLADGNTANVTHWISRAAADWLTDDYADFTSIIGRNTTVKGSMAVDTEDYDATGWNGDLTVPTKDAVRDKIETMTGGAGITGSTDGLVPYYDATDSRYEQAAGLFYNDTSIRLGINTTTPQNPIDSYSTSATGAKIQARTEVTSSSGGGIFGSMHNNAKTGDYFTAPTTGNRLGGFFTGSMSKKEADGVALFGTLVSGYAEEDWQYANYCTANGVPWACCTAEYTGATCTNLGTNIRFETIEPGTTSRTEKMRVTGAGNVLITGTVSATGLKVDHATAADGYVWTATDADGNGQWEASSGSSYIGVAIYSTDQAIPTTDIGKVILLTGGTAHTVPRLNGDSSFLYKRTLLVNNTNTSMTIDSAYASDFFQVNGVRSSSAFNLSAYKSAVVVATDSTGTYQVEDLLAGESQWTDITGGMYYNGGKIGVGTISPSDQITASLAGTGAFAAINTSAYGTGSGALVKIIADPGSAVDAADRRLGGLLWGGATDTSHTFGYGVGIEGFSDGAFTSTSDTPAYLSFKTAADNVAGRSERMRIKSNGVIRFIPIATPASCELGDTYVNSSDNKMYSCTTAGTPGTWTAHW